MRWPAHQFGARRDRRGPSWTPGWLATVAGLVLAWSVPAAAEEPCPPFDSALRHLEAGASATAEALLIRRLRCAPGDARAWNTLGALRLRAGDYTRAERLFRRAVALRPDHAKYRYNLAVALFRQGHYLEAARMVGELYRRDPDYLRRRIHPERARRILAETQARDPDDPILRRALRWLERHPDPWTPTTREVP